MTDNEKQRVAEWCEPCPSIPPTEDPQLSEGGHWIAEYNGVWVPCHKYDTLNACAAWERVAKERGLESEYERALIAVCGRALGKLGHNARTFDIATATPAQRVAAILAVIKGTKS